MCEAVAEVSGCHPRPKTCTLKKPDKQNNPNERNEITKTKERWKNYG